MNVPTMNQHWFPWPRVGTEMTSEGKITGELDWAVLDEWIILWPGARFSMIYL